MLLYVALHDVLIKGVNFRLKPFRLTIALNQRTAIDKRAIICFHLNGRSYSKHVEISLFVCFSIE